MPEDGPLSTPTSAAPITGPGPGPADAITAARALTPVLAARAERHDRDGSFPVEDFADIRTAGLLGVMVPARLGGVGAGFADYAEVAMALGTGNGATALVFNMHASVTGALAGTPEDLARALGVPESFFAMRDRVLAAAAAGAFYAVAMSERGAGSKLSQVATTYEPEDDGWRIRGHKTFCSGAGHADAYLVAARSLDGGRVSQFLVPAGAGVIVEPTWDSLGMRATGSHDLHIDVLAPADIDAATAYVEQRGLGRLPAVRARIGRADARVGAARLVVLEAARPIRAAPGEPETNRWVWRAKLLAGEIAMEVAASLLEAAGTAASRRGHPLERIF